MNSYPERRRPGLRTIVWFRGKDLRVGDHEPLARAAAEGKAIPLFVLEPRFFGPGRARRAPHRMQFLLESLAGLQDGLSERGSGLVLLEGPSTSALPRVAARWKADRVWAYRGSEPGGRGRDDEVARVLEAAGIRLGQDYPYPVVDHSRARDRFLKVARNYLRGRGVDGGG